MNIPVKLSDLTGPSRPSMYALGRLKTGQMNKTEQAYAYVLDDYKAANEILWWKFEGLRLKLADNTFYTPDFAVLAKDGILEMHEVKGYWMDDARAKVKIAADMYPFRFFGVTHKTKRDGGGWAYEAF